jgi:hypothetical protein
MKLPVFALNSLYSGRYRPACLINQKGARLVIAPLSESIRSFSPIVKKILYISNIIINVVVVVVTTELCG